MSTNGLEGGEVTKGFHSFYHQKLKLSLLGGCRSIGGAMGRFWYYARFVSSYIFLSFTSCVCLSYAILFTYLILFFFIFLLKLIMVQWSQTVSDSSLLCPCFASLLWPLDMWMDGKSDEFDSGDQHNLPMPALPIFFLDARKTGEPRLTWVIEPLRTLPSMLRRFLSILSLVSLLQHAMPVCILSPLPFFFPSYRNHFFGLGASVNLFDTKCLFPLER